MISRSSPYFKQAALLVEVLPLIARHDCFALKGGTAINLFIQDLPRLSVDIDLTYLPVQGREESLKEIGQTLGQIAQDIRMYVVGSSVEEISIRNSVSKLKVTRSESEIKIEPNLVLRGSVFACEDRDLCAAAADLFEMSVRMRIVSLPDLYGGKICAALDRQHPRDLFDMKFLLDTHGLSPEIRKGFLVYLISHNRPIHETLDPVMKDLRDIYETEFRYMAAESVSYEELLDVRHKLVEWICDTLTAQEKAFLVSFKEAVPEWPLLGLPSVERLPAVQWKLHNIRQMDPAKRIAFTEKLKRALRM